LGLKIAGLISLFSISMMAGRLINLIIRSTAIND
jgi:hypothetical protein